MKHDVPEQLRAQQIDQLVRRRSRQFAGMHNHTNRRMVNASLQLFTSELERTLLRTLLTGALWTAPRAYLRGMITSPLCPYCQQETETEEHILSHCSSWSFARDPHKPHVLRLTDKIPELPPLCSWPPCLKLCGLAPELPAPVNRQVGQHNLPFLSALHTMYVAVLAARKL